MKYRTLGKTGLKVSEIGYGTWHLDEDPDPSLESTGYVEK
jgi:aryl-alcohol dehydrogenase-like predicted oxidoreductase